MLASSFITARKRSLRRLCFYRCLSVHNGGVCMVALGGCAWFFGGVGVVHEWFFSGGCVVFSGGVWFFRGYAWFFLGGMHGFFLGVCGFSRGVACFFPGRGHAWFLGGAWFFLGGAWFFLGRACVGYDEIWSMSRWYASYWNAFLFKSYVLF